IATYGKWARSWPDSPTPHLRMAEVQRATKDNASALESLRKALALKPDLIDAQKGIMALQVANGQAPDALAMSKEIQKQRPKEAIGWMLEGDTYVATKDWSKASAAYREAMKRGTSTDLAVRLTVSLRGEGRGPEADRYAASWLKEHPKDKTF